MTKEIRPYLFSANKLKRRAKSFLKSFPFFLVSLLCAVCVSALDEFGRRYYRPRDARACLIVFDSFVCDGSLSLF